MANAGNAAVVSDALAERLAGSAAVLDDRSLATGLVAIQGPRALEVLAAADRRGPRRRCATTRSRKGPVAGIPALVARTGYTGEDGFEVFVDDRADRRALGRPAGRDTRARWASPVGLGARDTLRLEAGMPLYGNELDRTTHAVRCGPRPGREAGQGRRLRRAAPPSRRSRATARAGGSSGWSSRAAGSPATATRSTSATDAPAWSRAGRSRRPSAGRSRWRTSLRAMPSRVQ